MMTGPDLNDDDVLQAALGRALDAVEAPSAGAEQLARSAVELGRIDVELAELVSDSYVDVGSALDVRATGVDEGRMLTFAGDGLTLDLDLPTAGDAVLGQVAVEAADVALDEATVVIESAAGPTSLPVDELGRFRADLGRGPIRVALTVGERRLVTPWITR
jgi:hypothetical protein